MDTCGGYEASRTSGLQSTDCRLQNSVCLVKVSSKQFEREHSTQDLYTLTLMKNQEGDTVRKKVSISEYHDFDPNKAKEIVEMKQTELVRLAERHGLYDIRVFDRQLLLARSLIFRQYAAWSIIKKAGSQTPGIDREAIDPENREEMFQPLVEFLRYMIYHPNKYKPSAIKTV